MNTQKKQDQKKQRPGNRQEHGPKKQNRNHMYHEQELPETRMTD
jgi:hypothetical protein